MGSKADVANLVKIYRSIAEIPVINSGLILQRETTPDLVKVRATWSQRNLELGEITKFQKSFVLKPGSPPEMLFESPPQDTSSEELSKFSNSEKYCCIIRKVKQENKKKQFLEIWSGKGLYKNFDISAFDVHGEIYCDGEFGSLEWSPSEDSVMYIAEKKYKKGEPFYKQKPADAPRSENEKMVFLLMKSDFLPETRVTIAAMSNGPLHPVHFTFIQIAGQENIYRQDWGEQLVDKHQSVIGICDLKKETLTVLDGIPSHFCPGQVIWSPDGKFIYGVVFDTRPRRLGLVYCTNRTSYIFQMSSKGGEFKILSEPKKSVRSPRLSPNGKFLYWLEKPDGGVHNGCQELIRLELEQKPTKIVMIHMVQSPGQGFQGLYLHSLPARCMSNDGSKLFFSSCNKLRNSAFVLNTKTKEITQLETGSGSATVLDVHDDLVLISSGTMQQSPALRIANITQEKPEWTSLVRSEIVCRETVVRELEFEVKPAEQKPVYYNALYYGPTGEKNHKVPLIVYPHGGPHSATVNDFAFEPNFLVKAGFGVLMVNYRGSTGSGQAGVEFLIGKMGDTDVKDNHEAVLSLLKSLPQLDPKNIFLYGKSHGGYLAGRLSAQYPDFYRGVVAGNPVTDMIGMYLMSDIPDWATCGNGLPFAESKPIPNDGIHKMVAASTSHLCDKIKAPTLFLLGKNDLRVPYYEGVKLYHSLQARQLKVRLLLYDDNHTLGSVPNHIDCLINTALWFIENKHVGEE